ncbi:hypothetical protein HKBW3S34_02380, partial [Candidatus Hakubella thermalkaliphila]
MKRFMVPRVAHKECGRGLSPLGDMGNAA